MLSRTAVNERHLCGLGAPGNRPKEMGVSCPCIISLVVTRHQKLDSSFDNPLMSVWDAKRAEQELDLPF